ALGAFAARTIAALAALATRTTFAAAVAVPGRLGHAFGTRRERLHGETQASALVAIDELHLHAIALLHDVLGLLRALVTHLGDVDEAFGAGHDLDERAERRGRLHSSLIRLADHRLRGERLHHLARALHRLAADGCDRDEARVVDGELGARFV